MLLGHQRGSWGCLHRPQGMCRGSSKFTLENCKHFCGLKNWSKGCPLVVKLQGGAALSPKQTEQKPDETPKVTCWQVICSLFLLNPGWQGSNSLWLLKGATNTNSEVCVEFLFWIHEPRVDAADCLLSQKYAGRREFRHWGWWIYCRKDQRNGSGKNNRYL